MGTFQISNDTAVLLLGMNNICINRGKTLESVREYNFKINAQL